MTPIAEAAITGSAGAGCIGVHRSGDWTLIDRPSGLPSSSALGTSADLVAAAAPSAQPNTLVVTDGLSIYRSADGGCTWATTYTLGSDLPATSTAAPYYIAALATPATSAGGPVSSTVYAAVTPGLALTTTSIATAEPPTLLLVSKDGGGTWSQVSAAPTSAAPDIPRCNDTGTVVQLVVASDAKSMYVLCPLAAADAAASESVHGGHYNETIFRSSDGGASWVANQLPDLGSPTPGLAVESTSSVVWIAGESSTPAGQKCLGAWRSADNGHTWTGGCTSQADDAAIPETIAVAAGSPGRAARLLVSGSKAVAASNDYARSWTAVEQAPASWWVIQNATWGPNGETDVVEGGNTSNACGAQLRVQRHLTARVLRSVVAPTFGGGNVLGWTPHLIPGTTPRLVGLAWYLSPGSASSRCTSAPIHVVLAYTPKAK